MSKVVNIKNNFKADLYEQKVLVGGDSSEGFTWAGTIDPDGKADLTNIALSVFDGKIPQVGDKLTFNDPEFKGDVTLTAVGDVTTDTGNTKTANVTISSALPAIDSIQLVTGTRSSGEKFTRLASCTLQEGSQDTYDCVVFGEFEENEDIAFVAYANDGSQNFIYGTVNIVNISDNINTTTFELAFDPPPSPAYIFLSLYQKSQGFNFQKYLLKRRRMEV